MRRAPSRASSSRLGPTTAAAVVAIALRSGILCMGGVSFLAPRGRSRSLQPEGYAAFFMPPVHNLRVYLGDISRMVLTCLGSVDLCIVDGGACRGPGPITTCSRR